MPYSVDRDYTDSIHNSIAGKEIYNRLGWEEIKLEKELGELKDSEYSIDRCAIDSYGNKIYIQERFRRSQYRNYDDFTLRYQRPYNNEETEIYSEFFKMKGKMGRFDEPFYLLYGIATDDKRAFHKVAVIDLRAFFMHLRNKEIVVAGNGTTSYINNNVLNVVVRNNNDPSSNFMCCRVADVDELFDDVLVYQEGFIL